MKQSAIIALFVGAISASSIKQASADYTLPDSNTCTNANKATTTDESCSKAGNSAWNTITTSRTAKPKDAMTAPYPDHTEHLQLLQEGYTLPEANVCTNANKATTTDETCSTDGNSAWNTITTARTAEPKEAMTAPYPAHTEHV
jgi:protein tyrosine/serine phosphatase